MMMSGPIAGVITCMHHTMMVPYVVYATLERQGRKVAPHVDLYRGRAADMTRLPGRDRVDMRPCYARERKGTIDGDTNQYDDRS